MNDLYSNISIAQGLEAQSISAAQTISGTLGGSYGVMYVIDVASDWTAGQEIAITVEDSDDGATYAATTAYTGDATTIDTDNAPTIQAIDYWGRKPYVRVTLTPNGGSGSVSVVEIKHGIRSAL